MQESIASLAIVKSAGHLAFIGDYEYYDRSGAVHMAPIDNPVMTDGFRCGRFECQAWAWDRHHERLIETFGFGPIVNPNPFSDGFALAYSPLPDPIQSVPFRLRPVARFLAKPTWTPKEVRRMDAFGCRLDEDFGSLDDDTAHPVLLELEEAVKAWNKLCARQWVRALPFDTSAPAVHSELAPIRVTKPKPGKVSRPVKVSDPNALTHYVKARLKGKTAFEFMTGNGGVSRLKIHAANFTRVKAIQAAKEFASDDREWEFKAVRIDGKPDPEANTIISLDPEPIATPAVEVAPIPARGTPERIALARAYREERAEGHRHGFPVNNGAPLKGAPGPQRQSEIESDPRLLHSERTIVRSAACTTEPTEPEVKPLTPVRGVPGFSGEDNDPSKGYNADGQGTVNPSPILNTTGFREPRHVVRESYHHGRVQASDRVPTVQGGERRVALDSDRECGPIEEGRRPLAKAQGPRQQGRVLGGYPVLASGEQGPHEESGPARPGSVRRPETSGRGSLPLPGPKGDEQLAGQHSMGNSGGEHRGQTEARDHRQGLNVVPCQVDRGPNPDDPRSDQPGGTPIVGRREVRSSSEDDRQNRPAGAMEARPIALPDFSEPAPICGGSPEAILDPFATCLDIPTVDEHEADEWILDDAFEAIIVAPSRRSRLAHVEDAIRVIVLHILATEVRIGSAARVAWTHRMSQDRREDFAEWLEATGVRIDPFGDAPTDPAECFEWMVVESRDGCLVSFPEPSTDPDRSDDHDSDTEASSVIVPVPAGLRAGDAGQDHRAPVARDDHDGIGRLSPAGVPRGRGPAPRVEAPAPAAGVVEAPDTLTIQGRVYGLSTAPGGWDLCRTDGTCYRVTPGPLGLECDCPSFRFACRGIEGAQCKHCVAIRAAGLLPVPTLSGDDDGEEEARPLRSVLRQTGRGDGGRLDQVGIDPVQRLREVQGGDAAERPFAEMDEPAYLRQVRVAGEQMTPLGGDPDFSGSALLALHNIAPICGGSEESNMIVIRQAETPEERVDALDEETVRKVLVRLVKTTEAHGAPTVILRVLNEWSLLSDRVADVPDGIAPSLVEAMGHLLAPRLHVEATDPVAPEPPAGPLDVILATPIPSERGRIRRSDRKVMAAEVRKLFKELGIKGCSVTAPSYSMASGIDIRIPGAEEHDRGWQTGHDFATCDKCGKHRDAEKHIRVIIEGAFPDMIDRSDTQSDYHDNPLHIS